MKDLITHINRHFESRIRLGIMSALMVNDAIDFNSLKAMLDVTDGNLASHIKALEKEEYIEVKKQFLGKKPHTSYKVTKNGKSAFLDHLDALEKIIKSKT